MRIGLALRALALVLVAAVPVMAAPVPKELKQRPDSARMEGLWTVEGVGTRWYFVGEKLFAGGSDTANNRGIEYGLTVRPDGPLREFDLTQLGKSAYLGIYKFVGDDLHVAYHSGGQQRPMDFEQGAGKILHVLKRLPEQKK